MRSREDFLEIEDGRLHYQVDGDGEPILFLHGLGLDARMWNGEVARFAREYTVVRCDLRGFGRSSLPAAPYAHTADLARLLAHLGIERSHLVGLSMGGGIAIDFALTHPNATRSLALVDSHVGGFAWRESGAVMGAAGEAAKQRGIAAGREQWLANPLFAPALRDPEVASRLRAMVADYSGWHFVHESQLRALQPPAWERLRRIAAPTLVLVGELDLADFRTMAEYLIREISGARGHVLPGVGHMVNMEAPELFHEHLSRFLSDCSEGERLPRSNARSDDVARSTTGRWPKAP